MGILKAEVYICILMILIFAFVLMPGKTDRIIQTEGYTVHESKRCLILGILGVLSGLAVVSFMLSSGMAEEDAAMVTAMIAFVVGIFLISGIGFIICYYNRKIIIRGKSVIYQNIWRKRKIYRLQDLRINEKSTMMTPFSSKAKEIMITIENGGKAFQLERNMVNAECFEEQLKQLGMERTQQLISKM